MKYYLLFFLHFSSRALKYENKMKTGNLKFNKQEETLNINAATVLVKIAQHSKQQSPYRTITKLMRNAQLYALYIYLSRQFQLQHQSIVSFILSIPGIYTGHSMRVKMFSHIYNMTKLPFNVQSSLFFLVILINDNLSNSKGMWKPCNPI